MITYSFRGLLYLILKGIRLWVKKDMVVVDTTLIDSKNKYTNNYIYNVIVNYKKETKNITKIKENDIIKEIILKHYLNNKKQTRKDILKTYFTNTSSKQKFKNK